MNEPMSKNARKKHLRTAGQNCCPYCKADSEELDYEEFSPVECGDVEQEVTCTKCNRRWMDIFRLVDVQELCNKE